MANIIGTKNKKLTLRKGDYPQEIGGSIGPADNWKDCLTSLEWKINTTILKMDFLIDRLKEIEKKIDENI